MPDEVFLISNTPDSGFINDCEYRVLSKPDTPSTSAALCKLVSMEAHNKFGITPKQCAHCRRNSNIDQAFVRGKIIALIKHQLGILQLGFYASRPQEEVEALFLRAYKHFVMPSDRQFLVHQFTAAVVTKRVDKKWADSFLLEKMPDLLKPPSIEEIGGAIFPKLSVNPAQLKDRALDVDFGCCGGRNIFRMLHEENLTLSAPNGVPFTLPMKNIASVVPMPESNVLNANTMIRLHNGGVMMAKEQKTEIAIIIKDLANATGVEDREENSLTAKMINAGRSVLDVAKSLYGETVTKEVYEDRKKACEACSAINDKGEVLFRKGKREGWYSCGTPFWKHPLRNREIEGCGCWLHIKWGGVDQHCPLKDAKW